jgi:cobalt-zinc-cadmium efflux system outer membrane protein
MSHVGAVSYSKETEKTQASGIATIWRGFRITTARALLAACAGTALTLVAVMPVRAQSVPTRVTLDQAIELALQHNPALLAERTLILQNQALEVTANLRPNPTFDADAQFLPFFNPSNFTSTYLDNGAQFDLGVGYLFERGKKRQHRLQAAKDQTAVTDAQVRDFERTLTFNVGQQFINVLLAQSTLDLADQDVKSFQQTVDIGQAQYKAGAISEGDFLMIKLQLLQFQADVFAAKLAKVQALAALRQQIGFSAVPENFDVEGDLVYQPVHAGEDDLKALALRTRTDLIAAQRGVTAAMSAEKLAEANGKVDVTGTLNYTHVGDVNSLSAFVNVPIPVFNRNQGEIARTKAVITQSQALSTAASEQVLSDVVTAYAGLHTNDQIIQLYQSGYLDDAKTSRDISEYAYRRGATSLLDFLDAERTYRAAQLAYRQALASYMTIVEQLREAVGTRTLP